MGQKCAKCGKAWALKTPDSDGISRCLAHSINPRTTTKVPTPTIRLGLKTRADVLEALEVALEASVKKKDPHAMIAAARTAIAAIQMVDPMAPEQELGAFNVNRVSGQQRPTETPEPEPIQADAE